MATTTTTDLQVKTVTPLGARTRGLRFHFAVALFFTASLLVGFYFDLPKYVLRPTVDFPAILQVHSIVFVGWMLLYLVQTLLVQRHKVGLHRLLGWTGLALAIVMPPLGIATAIVMRRFDLLHFPSQDVPRDLAFLAAPLADIIAFAPCIWLGIALRKRRDCHSRLMFLSITSVADTGLGRLPIPGANKWFFLGNLTFYAAGIVHDRLTLGHIHKVFAWGVPAILLVDTLAMYLWLAHPTWWLAICRALTGIG